MSPGSPRPGTSGLAAALPAYVLPLAVIAVLAAARIPYPLHGDQTLFLMGAETMQRGGTLYVDFWDTKQPGIFLFYWLAGRLFGFTPVGVHLFELLWHLVLAAWMIRLLRPRLAIPGLASMAPVMAIGGYYAVAGNWELTQAEMLSALPLFACLAAVGVTGAAAWTTRLAWFASGMAAGVAVLFKLLLAPIPAGIWILLSLSNRRAYGTAWSTLLFERWLPAALGTAFVLGATVAGFAAAGALEPLLWTSFAYPLEAVGAGAGPDPGKLLSTARWALAAFWPLVGFALLSRLRVREEAAERPFLAAAVWWGTGIAVFLVQTLSWWRYHALLLLVPVAMLAARGIDGLARAARERFRAAAPAAIAFLLALLACAPAVRARLGDPLFPPRLETADDLVAWQRQSSPAWDRLWLDTAFLRAPDARPGAIYVFGDPRAIVLGHRRQAIAINGWSWESYAQRQWDALPAAIASAAPAYVGVEPPYERLLRDRAPEVWAWLQANYRLVKSGEERSWYERNEAGG